VVVPHPITLNFFKVRKKNFLQPPTMGLLLFFFGDYFFLGIRNYSDLKIVLTTIFGDLKKKALKSVQFLVTYGDLKNSLKVCTIFGDLKKITLKSVRFLVT